MEIFRQSNFIDISSDLCSPIHDKDRIKYTCYDSSESYIVCGANSGSLYIFQREPIKFLQLIPTSNGIISHVSISPRESYIALTTEKGTISIYVIDLTSSQPNFSSYYLESITQIKWRQTEAQIILGDTKGQVFLVNLTHSMGRNTIILSIHPILFLESPIVQITAWNGLILVSNFTKCVLCNVESEEFKQIGNQPRHGRFGACFSSVDWNDTIVNENTLLKTRIFCARPGARIWECDVDGNVLKTHKFKSACVSEQTHSDFPTCFTPENSKQLIQLGISEQLIHLQAINKHYVLAHSMTSIYVFDLIHSKIVLYNDRFGAIHSVNVVNDRILVFTKDYKAYTFQMKRLDDLFSEIMNNKQYIVGAQMLVKNSNYFREKFSPSKLIYYYSIFQKKLSDEKEGKRALKYFLGSFQDVFKKYNDGNLQSSNIIEKDMITDGKLSAGDLNSQYDDKDELDEEFNRLDMNDTEWNVKKENQDKTTTKLISEEDKSLQELFFIYKSADISKLCLKDRYVPIFDRHDPQKLLAAFELMIRKYDGNNKTPHKAKQISSRMYLNYMNSIQELPDELEPFIIECFVVANSFISKRNNQRCDFCHFPIAIPQYDLNHQAIAHKFITKMLKMKETDRIFDIICFVPTLLNVLLKCLINDSKTHFKSEKDFELMVDILFICANRTELELSLKKISSQKWICHFWKAFLNRAIRLHNEKTVKCIRCNNCSTIKSKSLSRVFAYDYLFKQCSNMLYGPTALELCTEVAKDIPDDSIGKQFFLKCLLNS